jgi:superoxide dismutase
MSVRDQDYSRNASRALNSIFIFLLQRSINHEAIRDKMKTKNTTPSGQLQNQISKS